MKYKTLISLTSGDFIWTNQTCQQIMSKIENSLSGFIYIDIPKEDRFVILKSDNIEKLESKR
jgi:hypothetical protein